MGHISRRPPRTGTARSRRAGAPPVRPPARGRRAGGWTPPRVHRPQLQTAARCRRCGSGGAKNTLTTVPPVPSTLRRIDPGYTPVGARLADQPALDELDEAASSGPVHGQPLTGTCRPRWLARQTSRPVTGASSWVGGVLVGFGCRPFPQSTERTRGRTVGARGGQVLGGRWHMAYYDRGDSRTSHRR